MNTFDTAETVSAANIIDRWALLRPMSGEAFSTALRHAAMLDMGEALSCDGLAYDVSGYPIEEGENRPIGLSVDIARRPLSAFDREMDRLADGTVAL